MINRKLGNWHSCQPLAGEEARAEVFGGWLAEWWSHRWLILRRRDRTHQNQDHPEAACFCVVTGCRVTGARAEQTQSSYFRNVSKKGGSETQRRMRREGRQQKDRTVNWTRKEQLIRTASKMIYGFWRKCKLNISTLWSALERHFPHFLVLNDGLLEALSFYRVSSHCPDFCLCLQ